MFLEIKGILAPNEIARLITLSQDLHFVDGRLSNPANQTKQNLQADTADPRYRESVQIVSTALGRAREFKDFALPRRMAPPLLSRYEAGMKYGAHGDSAFISVPGGVIRSDVSCTIFLTEPTSYEGGELVIHLGTSSFAVKGAAGDAILYPSTTLHEVNPVRSGVRMVSITFIESMISDQHKRYLVYELNEVSALAGVSMNFEHRMRLELVRSNLLRMWSS